MFSTCSKGIYFQIMMFPISSRRFDLNMHCLSTCSIGINLKAFFHNLTGTMFKAHLLSTFSIGIDFQSTCSFFRTGSIFKAHRLSTFSERIDVQTTFSISCERGQCSKHTFCRIFQRNWFSNRFFFRTGSMFKAHLLSTFSKGIDVQHSWIHVSGKNMQLNHSTLAGIERCTFSS